MAAVRRGRSSIVLSSIPLQMLLCLSGIYSPIYFLATLFMIIYKIYMFAYPSNYLALDLVFLWILGVLEALRLFLGIKGNLTEEETLLGSSLLLTLTSSLLSVYFMVWTTYVLRADVLLNLVLLVLCSLESILQVVTIAAFVS